MKETCMVQSKVISTGSVFTSVDFLTVQMDPFIWRTDTWYSFSNVGFKSQALFIHKNIDFLFNAEAM